MEAAIDLDSTWIHATIATAVLFQLYRSGQFYWWSKNMFPEKTTDLPQGTDQLYPIINDLRLDVDVALGNIDGVFTRHSLSFIFVSY
jgi:hypothetical protein